MARLGKVLVAGVGLIGGSFALALKAAGVVDEVVGLGRRRETLEAAQALGILDRIAEDWSDGLEHADLVLLGMPVGQMSAAFAAMAPHLASGTVVTDGGSTKSDVVAAARAALGGRIDQFVPGHPIAGAEKSGPAAAVAELYRDKRVVLTPLPENPAAAVARVRAAWEACGARVSELTPEGHDRTFAAVSHLPHLLAYALVHEIADRENAEQLFSFAASGFRDFTRIASSHPEMWRDISIANRHALLQELDAYMAQLLRLRVLLASADGPGLEALFDAARRAREAWLNGGG
ncbi:prephenate dehydrogenase [Denitratisoma sp. DHT3]|uniref:prephenate dehydrogenase n=1 Tax=Denitratisoma sp. DHT3 TaxID=1981880 RepID=UPI0011982B20|nr:prephenate dehydrogenase/arogenate dehydrogenase family protein [Denitratisoma sp. DHT3]QDX81299.1 prephenate dehydrogenase [Denitratisoma sp. DHT3]